MERVYGSDSNPSTLIEGVGIAVGVTGPNQRHTGLLHLDSESGTLLMLDLAWDFVLCNRPPQDAFGGGFVWVDPAVLPRRRLKQVAAVCRKVWRANGRRGIPFGFNSPSNCFDEATGAFLLGPTRLGLTCAAFVLAVFHYARLPLVKYETWPRDRRGDREWQERIVSILEHRGAEPDRIRALRSDVGAVRYRPEEVAGAATVSALPAEFEIAEQRGQQIVQRL